MCDCRYNTYFYFFSFFFLSELYLRDASFDARVKVVPGTDLCGAETPVSFVILVLFHVTAEYVDDDLVVVRVSDVGGRATLFVHLRQSGPRRYEHFQYFGLVVVDRPEQCLQ